LLEEILLDEILSRLANVCNGVSPSIYDNTAPGSDPV
jgi:hypothetical protein